jgi:hypothetical protein
MLTAAAWEGVVMNREEPKKKKVISNQLVGRHKKSNIKNSPYGPMTLVVIWAHLPHHHCCWHWHWLALTSAQRREGMGQVSGDWVTWFSRGLKILEKKEMHC